MESITPVMREQLRKPLPKEAISKHPTKTFLSSIKAIYVEERLNEVFGVGAWTTKAEHVITEKSQKANKNGVYPLMVVCKLTFEIPKYGVYHESYGGNDNEDLGDAYKGAVTDAITKIGSYLEIGIDVFKGLKDAPQVNSKPSRPISKEGVTEATCSVCGQIALPSKFGKGYYCPNRCKGKIIEPDKRSEIDKKIGAELDAIPVEEVDIDLIK